MSQDPYRLQRFVAAQADCYEQALAELQAGAKRSHWIWFIFPQLAGLGRSPQAQFYGIAGLDEARAYLAHPLLGPRLIECAQALLALNEPSAEEVLGPIDAMKLRSSATLFAQVSPADSVFHRLLERFYAGQADPATTGRPD